MLHPLWFFPIAVVAVGLITWREIGPSSLAGLAITFLMLILQLVGSRLLVFFRYVSHVLLQELHMYNSAQGWMGVF